MGYDVDFIRVPPDQVAALPLEGSGAQKALRSAERIADAQGVVEVLLKLPGCRPGPKGSVDFIGKGLNYARLSVRESSIHVENNCGAGELLRIYNHLLPSLPGLLIHDLQSGQLHDAASFERWWSRPL
jgi:hypothetical protein